MKLRVTDRRCLSSSDIRAPYRVMTLGWDEAWDAARRAVDPDGALAPVRVAIEHRGAYHVTDGTGVAWAELTGRAFHRAADKRALPTVGDWLLVESWADALAGRG